MRASRWTGLVPALVLGLGSLPILAVDGLVSRADAGRAVAIVPGHDGADALARLVAAGALPVAPGGTRGTWLVTGDAAAFSRLRAGGSILLDERLMQGCGQAGLPGNWPNEGDES
ncbi:hypothetical protein [Zavarzinia sp. CC-PAN008]|uniref:hypothetical protein n=1 Tax=Zavarzinia sp. CC-PAN008 TaxID=3243332 RepID=UPI003F745F41